MKKKIAAIIGILLVAVMCLAIIPACSEEEEKPDVTEEPTMAGLTISKTEITMNVNTTEQLTATTKDSAQYVITWASSAVEIASVANGLVTANSAGEATITVSCRKKGSATVLESKTCAVTVTGHMISLDKTNIFLLPDTGVSTATVTASVEGSDEPVVWTSNDDKIASVSDGVITAHRTGVTSITVRSGDLTNECKVTVANKASVKIGETVTLAPSSASPVWSSSDETIAKVQDGTVTGIGIGTATITASYGQDSEIFIVSVVAESDMKEYELASGKKSDAAKTPGVWNYLLESSEAKISGTPTFKNGALAINITNVGTSGANFAYMRYQPDATGGKFYNVHFYVWSAEESVIAINGIDTEISPGANVLSFKYTSKKPSAADTFQLKFRTTTSYIIAPYFEEAEPEIELTLDKKSIELLPGGTATITATYKDDSVIEWETSNAAVATVADGVVTAHAVGAATITAKCGDKSAACNVTVTSAAVTLSQTFATLYLQDSDDGTSHNSLTLTAVSSENADIAWSSFDSSVVTVTNDGVITAVKAGWATVTATAGNATRDCVVFVADTKAEYSMKEGKNASVPDNPGVWFWAGNKGSGVDYDNGTITADFAAGHTAISGATTFMVRYMPFIENGYKISYKLRIECSANVGENDIITVTAAGAAVMELKPAQLAAGVEIESTDTVTGMYQLKVSGIVPDVSAKIVISDIAFAPVA